MPFKGRIVAEIRNDDAANPANMNFDFDSVSLTVQQCAARVLGYLGSLGTAMFAAGTNLVVLKQRPDGAGGAVDMPFPQAEYDAARAVVSSGFSVWTGYGPIPMASSAQCPKGTSVSVSELTQTPGKTGRGRHFIPFIGRDVINGFGTLNTAVPAVIAKRYADCFGVYLGPVAPVGAQIASQISVVGKRVPLTNEPVGGYKFVSSVKCQATPTSLRSRRS